VFCFTEQNSYFSFPESQSFRSLKLLFANCSSEVDVVSRSCLSDVSSLPLFVRFPIVCLALSIWARNLRDRAAFKDNLQASFLAACCSTLSGDSGCKSVASELSLSKSCLNARVAQVRKDISQVRTSITVSSQATSGSLGAVEVKATDTGISLWVWDDGTIFISVCLRIIEISIPDLTLKFFECRLFAICSFPSTCSHLCSFLFMCVRGELRSHFQLKRSV